MGNPQEGNLASGRGVKRQREGGVSDVTLDNIISTWAAKMSMKTKTEVLKLLLLLVLLHVEAIESLNSKMRALNDSFCSKENHV